MTSEREFTRSEVIVLGFLICGQLRRVAVRTDELASGGSCSQRTARRSILSCLSRHGRAASHRRRARPPRAGWNVSLKSATVHRRSAMDIAAGALQGAVRHTHADRHFISRRRQCTTFANYVVPESSRRGQPDSADSLRCRDGRTRMWTRAPRWSRSSRCRGADRHGGPVAEGRHSRELARARAGDDAPARAVPLLDERLVRGRYGLADGVDIVGRGARDGRKVAAQPEATSVQPVPLNSRCCRRPRSRRPWPRSR